MLLVWLACFLISAARAAGEPACAVAFPPEAVALEIDLGDIMGQPVECPHADLVTRDTLQATTGGLFYVRTATRTPSFTDGQVHFALTPAGVLAWPGPTQDPPASTADLIAPPRPTYVVLSAGSDPGPNASIAVAAALDPARRSFLRVISIPSGTRVTVYAGDEPEQLVTAPWAEEIVLPDPSAQPHWTAEVFKEESHLPSIIAVQLIQAATE